MRLKVFAVYDSQLAAYFHPFYCPHEAIAKRSFSATANDPTSQIYAHPADFTLFEIATWDDETSKFENHNQPINYGNAAVYRSKDHAQGTPQPERDEAHLQRGAEGGHSA